LFGNINSHLGKDCVSVGFIDLQGYILFLSDVFPLQYGEVQLCQPFPSLNFAPKLYGNFQAYPCFKVVYGAWVVEPAWVKIQHCYTLLI